MAMTKCKECKKEVSTSAKICPHCGVKEPGVTFLQKFIGALFLIAIIAFALSTCSGEKSTPKQTSTPSENTTKSVTKTASKWYEGGTLHDSNALDWQAANNKNKLATTADFLAAFWTGNKLSADISKKISSINDLKPLAEQLTKELDAAFAPESDAALNKQLFTNQKVSETAVMIMMINGWLKN